MRRYLLLSFFTISAFSGCWSQIPDSVQGAKKYGQGITLFKKGEYFKAIDSLTSALEFFTPNHKRAYAETLVRIGIAYAYIPNYEKEFEYFQLAEPYARELSAEGDHYVIINQQVQYAFGLYELRRFKEALPKFEEAERLILKDSMNYYLLSYINGSRGRIYVKSGEFEKGAVFLEKGLEYARLSRNYGAQAQALNVNSSYYLEIGNILKAKELNLEILKLYESNDESDLNIAIIYDMQGRLEMTREEYEVALSWMERAEDIYKKYPDKRLEKHSYNAYNLAIAHNNLGNYQLANRYASKALAINKLIQGDLDYLVPSYNTKIDALIGLKLFDSARYCLNIIEPSLRNGELTVLIRSNAMLSKATFYSEIKSFKEAEQVFDDVVNLLRKDFSNKFSPLPMAYYEYSKMEFENGNYDNALQLINLAIEHNRTNAVQGQSEDDRIISPSNYLRYLIQKSLILEKLNLDDLQPALEPIETGLTYIQNRRVQSVGVQFSSDWAVKLRNQALDICYKMYSVSKDPAVVDKAFQYAELAKSQQLFEWINTAVNSGSGGLSIDHQRKQMELIGKVNLYTGLLANNPDSTRVAAYQDSLFDYKQQYFNVLREFKTQYPAYYQSIYSKMQVPIHMIQDQLNGDQLVSFNVSDSSIYVFVIGNNVQLFRLDGLEVSNLVSNYLKQLADPSSDYLTDGAALYDQLWKPLGGSIEGTRTVLISDGILNYLPFELLVAEKTFLMEHYDISYAYSAAVFLSEPNSSLNAKSQLVAFAPTFDQTESSDVIRGEIGKLPGAIDEVKSIGQIFSGKLFLNEQASETNFKDWVNNSSVVHIASHAIINDLVPEQTRLLFYQQEDSLNDGDLFLLEIFNMNLPAQLVTLSACNTGYGQLKAGEGVMSLSRAFAYAGVPATVVSLWPASDKSTPELMKYFYQNLKDGQPKDVALNNARKSYLANATGKARHPFYWGGFVLIGDNSAIKSGDDTLTLAIAGFMVLLLVVVIVLSIKKFRDR